MKNNPREVVHLRVRPGSALERLLKVSAANKTDTVHEIAARLEVYERPEK